MFIKIYSFIYKLVLKTFMQQKNYLNNSMLTFYWNRNKIMNYYSNLMYNYNLSIDTYIYIYLDIKIFLIELGC